MKFKIKKLHREGEIVNRWYLPVWRNLEKLDIEEWIFFLAIPVLFFKMISHILWVLWLDLLDFQKGLIYALSDRRKK